MGSQRKTREQAEESVKGYELDAVQIQVDAQEKLMGGMDKKLDTILDEVRLRPTAAEVDAKIELAVKNAIEKQDLKYAPIVKNNRWLLGLLVSSGIGLIVTLILLIIGLAKG